MPGIEDTILKPKKDKFKSARGGYSRFLQISCRQCQTKLLIYQKDGPGNLRRLYLDRIFSPSELSELQNLGLNEVPDLVCGCCKQVLAVPYLYPKEKRPAFKLFQDSVVKKIIKAKK